MAAAAVGSTACIQTLLGQGADPWQADLNGFTALHYACSAGHTKAAELLLEAGSHSAGPWPRQCPTPPFGRCTPYADAPCKLGLTPLHLAAERGHADCVAILLRYGASIAARGHARLASSKLRAVFGISSAVGTHATPLHVAAHRGDLAVVRLLLAYQLERVLVSAAHPVPEPRLHRNSDGLRPLDLVPAAAAAPPAPAAAPARHVTATGTTPPHVAAVTAPLPSLAAATERQQLMALLEPTNSLSELMPEVVAAATTIHAHSRIGGAVPTLQQLAAAALSARLASSAATAAAAKAGREGPPAATLAEAVTMQGKSRADAAAKEGAGDAMRAGASRPQSATAAASAAAAPEAVPTPAVLQRAQASTHATTAQPAQTGHPTLPLSQPPAARPRGYTAAQARAPEPQRTPTVPPRPAPSRPSPAAAAAAAGATASAQHGGTAAHLHAGAPQRHVSAEPSRVAATAAYLPPPPQRDTPVNAASELLHRPAVAPSARHAPAEPAQRSRAAAAQPTSAAANASQKASALPPLSAQPRTPAAAFSQTRAAAAVVAAAPVVSGSRVPQRPAALVLPLVDPCCSGRRSDGCSKQRPSSACGSACPTPSSDPKLRSTLGDSGRAACAGPGPRDGPCPAATISAPSGSCGGACATPSDVSLRTCTSPAGGSGCDSGGGGSGGGGGGAAGGAAGLVAPSRMHRRTSSCDSTSSCGSVASSDHSTAVSSDGCSAAGRDGESAANGAGGGGSAGRTVAEEDGAEVCGICMAESVAVRGGVCGHPVCGDCAAALCAQVARKLLPLSCPFCRRQVPSFAPLHARS